MHWTTFLRNLLAEQQHAQHSRSMGLCDAGELVELLAKPEPTRCPHCDRQQPPVQLRTRRRRLYELRGPAGQTLHYEIEP
jgi:hypothetical protein